MPVRPVVLCILDGWGLSPAREGNAVAQAHTPNFDRIWAECPHSQLAAHGPDVGLPEGQMGNSEVGHMNIGAGRIVWMDLPRIDRAIETGELAANPRLQAFIAALKVSGGTAHLAGLASPGGVHAHQRHIAAVAAAIAGAGVPVAVHAFLDGRDVPPQSAVGQIAALEAALPPGARIATVSGRFYAMDRDKRWERVAQATAAILLGAGDRAPTAAEAIAAAYARGETDEFVTPCAIGAYAGARDGDGVFFANFRADRAREILGALVDPAFDGFVPDGRPDWAAVLGMVEYSDRLNAVMPAMFPSDDIVNPLGAWLAGQGLTQFRLAETEKYPHVTFFFNGGVETPAPGETRRMAPSPKVRTYDLQPEMSAGEVTAYLVEAIRSGDARPDRGELRQSRHGRAHRRPRRRDQGGRGGGRRARRGAGGAGGRRRGDDRHRRPRQLRGDGRPRDRRAAHRAHAQPGAGGRWSADRRARGCARAGGSPTSPRRSSTCSASRRRRR